ncbi:ABC transporter permease [Actinomadura pelletieri]|uniref:ABC transporter permease n=1 Tax=Actinomadura pelletieri TaxID=111805 RepID=UPI003B5B1038
MPRPRLSLRLISPLVLLALWQITSSTGVLPERLLPSPATVAGTAVTLTADGTLIDAVTVSLQRAVIGFLAGAVAGLALALVAGLSRTGEGIVDPPMQMLRALPLFGLIPLFILWFGIGEIPKVILVAFGVLFPIYLNTYSGIRGVDARLAEVGQVLRLGRAALIRHIVLPGALPQTLVGLRQSLGVAWLALIVAEQVNASKGLGFMINDAREFLRIDIVVLGLLVYAVLGLTTDALVRLLERRALSWRRGLVAT